MENRARRSSLRYDAALLDIDGTLVDSNGAHASAWSEAFAAHGHRISPERIRPLIGKGGDKVLCELATVDNESAEGQAITEQRANIFKERYLPTLKPTPGAESFVEWLIDTGIKVIVATSAKKEELKGLLAVCGALSFLHDATTSDDAERSKPDPDIVTAALQKSHAPANRAIMIGDTPYDIEAAGRAGIATIAFRCGGWDDDGLKAAIAIYDNPGELLVQLIASPFLSRPS